MNIFKRNLTCMFNQNVYRIFQIRNDGITDITHCELPPPCCEQECLRSLDTTGNAPASESVDIHDDQEESPEVFGSADEYETDYKPPIRDHEDQILDQLLHDLQVRIALLVFPYLLK